MNALTFLGTGKYEPTTYVWRDTEGEQSYQTHLFPEAVARIFQPEQLIIFVTRQAKEHQHFRVLRERLGERMQPVDIPEGKSEPELWQIFDACAGAVPEGEEILLDVTHAFRSLPLIVFTVAAYLRRAKGVTINRLVYGAYEARDGRNRSPIFDLTPLLDLLEWLSGAEALVLRGDANTLADRLDSTHRRLWKEREERAGTSLPQRLQVAAAALRNLSRAIFLSRPVEVMEVAQRLLPLLDEVAGEAERWAKPFALILEQVRADVAGLAHDEPTSLDEENLRRQLAIIEYYLKRNLAIQAVTLAREWLVSWACYQRAEGDWLSSADRKVAEDALGQAAAHQRKGIEVPGWFASLPQAEQAAKIWDSLSDVRNDIAHCGMRVEPRPSRSIEQQAKEIPHGLAALLDGTSSPALWGGRVTIELSTLYSGSAKLEDLPLYLEQAKASAGEGNEVVLTGQAPIWLYLAVAHALHGKARKLLYTSPVTGEVLVFDHTPT